jgi:hypothetical protein
MDSGSGTNYPQKALNPERTPWNLENQYAVVGSSRIDKLRTESEQATYVESNEPTERPHNTGVMVGYHTV